VKWPVIWYWFFLHNIRQSRVSQNNSDYFIVIVSGQNSRRIINYIINCLGRSPTGMIFDINLYLVTTKCNNNTKNYNNNSLSLLKQTLKVTCYLLPSCTIHTIYSLLPLRPPIPYLLLYFLLPFYRLHTFIRSNARKRIDHINGVLHCSLLAQTWKTIRQLLTLKK